jgi:hypothetical protein
MCHQVRMQGNLMVKEAISFTLDRTYLPLTCTFVFMILCENLFRAACLIETHVAPVSSRSQL